MQKALASSLPQVTLRFSADLLAATATDPDHYKLNNGIKVLTMDYTEGEKTATLTTQETRPAIAYMVTVSGVLSARRQHLDRGHKTATFTTP